MLRVELEHTWNWKLTTPSSLWSRVGTIWARRLCPWSSSTPSGNDPAGRGSPSATPHWTFWGTRWRWPLWWRPRNCMPAPWPRKLSCIFSSIFLIDRAATRITRLHLIAFLGMICRLSSELPCWDNSNWLTKFHPGPVISASRTPTSARLRSTSSLILFGLGKCQYVKWRLSKPWAIWKKSKFRS